MQQGLTRYYDPRKYEYHPVLTNAESLQPYAATPLRSPGDRPHERPELGEHRAMQGRAKGTSPDHGDESMASAWRERRSGNDLARAWQGQGNNEARARQDHGKDMARAWQAHGKGKARAWQECGNSMSGTRQQIARASQQW